MQLAKKILLKPTPEQENLFWRSAGTARWAYNYFLSENFNLYAEYLKNNKMGVKYKNGIEIQKYINNELKPTTHTWLKEVGSQVMKQGIINAEKAMQRWFKGISGKPKFKSKKKSKISFYVNYASLKKVQGGFKGEKIGFVRTAEELPKIPQGKKYSNPYISFDGKHWFLSISYEIPQIDCDLTDKSIGIDLGVKDLAICSNNKVYKNINKTKRVKQLKKKLKRAERKLSRKYLKNTKSYTKDRKPIYSRPLYECKNINKQIGEIRCLYKKLTDIRTNYIHQTTTEIVKTKPSRVVMEDLNVRGMMKNKHLAKAIQEQCFYEFIRQMKYKCEKYGIEFVQADRFYPSSKKCSYCGNIKKDLELSDRTYICSECGLVIDRDYNASINLANYKSA